MNDEFVYISNRLLKANHICFDAKTFKTELVSHPYYPAIWALTDTLKLMNIDFKVVKTDWESLSTLEYPSLVHFNEKGGHFKLVTQITDREIVYIDDITQKAVTEPKESFLAKWDKVLGYIEQCERKPMLKCLNWKSILLSAIWVLAFCITVGMIIGHRGFDFYLGGVLFIKLIGLLFSVTLILHSFGKENFLSQKACHLNAHTDCNAVLSSKAAKIWDISMSDIGIVYFFSGLILLWGSYIYGNWEKTIYLLGLVSILSIPYSVFSICYQYFVVKKWCMLCLGTLLTLALEIIFFAAFSHVSSIHVPSLIILIGVTICNSILWRVCRNKMKEIHKLKETNLLYLSLKKNNEIFSSLWKESKPCHNVTLGKFNFINNGGNTVDIALSLHCNFCAKTFEQIKELFDKRPSLYSFRFYFAWSKNDTEQHIFIHRLISIYLSQGEKAFLLYLQKWYTNKDYAILNAENVSCLIDEEIFQDYMKGCYEWYNINHINQTPTIYVSGKSLPSIYNVKDLFYFSDFL